MCSTDDPAVNASTCEPAALPAAVPVLVIATPRERETRAYASAMFIAPASPRAGTKRIRPCLAIASRIGMLWMEITPNATVTPMSASARAIASPTSSSDCAGGFDTLIRSAVTTESFMVSVSDPRCVVRRRLRFRGSPR